eukprot:TRINITY_DN29732_c0_g1_i1.p1 TRINITY_DN29732_c0_g1~~TRINITY_DN29732_c0_g1_i1.p1  ORF type:complete len:316 (+),score=139.94 TRINITY_DN29732_c0_g1_i1:70-948(+)
MASAGARGTSARGGAKYTANETNADFPILCETCLGPNQYVRMIRMEFNKECNVCARPTTSFRWKPGRDARYKTTVVCQTCSKMKNVCQCCLFDLEYGLPTAVRDKHVEGEAMVNHKSAIQTEYFAAQNEKKLAEGTLTAHQSGATRETTNPELLRMARRQPSYNRNRAKVCSFFLKGECTRGKACPYRHDNDTYDTVTTIKDRYFGVKDPAAQKMLERQKARADAEEQKKKLAAEGRGRYHARGGDDDDFDPSAVPLPPCPAPGTLDAPAMNIPAYPSTNTNWMGEEARREQ